MMEQEEGGGAGEPTVPVEQHSGGWGTKILRRSSVLHLANEIPDHNIKLIKKLGEGSFGVVFAGECFGSPVAVKVPRVQSLEELSPEELDDLRVELNIMINNRHPNLIMCLGACTIPQHFKIVLELLDGDLESLLVNTPDMAEIMPLYQRLLLAKQTALGMNWLHSADPAVIHRDLKLENLLYKKIDSSYTVKISDFGLAVLKPKTATLIGQQEGTPLTMAPEIMIGADYDTKADVYSFGMVLWSITMCKALYEDLRDLPGDKFAYEIWRNNKRPPIPPDCLPDLAALMQQCWQKDPDNRPDFNEINERLDNILVEAAISDEAAQKFWLENFLKERFVAWEKFQEAVVHFLYGPEGPKFDITTELQCLQELIAEREMLSKGLTMVVKGSGLGPFKKKIDIEAFGNVLSWFGPFEHSFLRNIKYILEKKWFHGTVSHQEAETKVEGRPKGTFLVRLSTTQRKAFVVTISMGDTQEHIRILKKPYTYEFEGDEETSYPSLVAIIEEGLKKKLNLEETFPCPGWPFAACFARVDPLKNLKAFDNLKTTVNAELLTVSGKEKKKGRNKDSSLGNDVVLIRSKDKRFLEQVQQKRKEKAEERKKAEEEFEAEQERRRKKREEIKKLLAEKQG